MRGQVFVRDHIVLIWNNGRRIKWSESICGGKLMKQKVAGTAQ
jgi:hypothetical protein